MEGTTEQIADRNLDQGAIQLQLSNKEFPTGGQIVIEGGTRTQFILLAEIFI